jgi:hypothetical protein
MDVRLRCWATHVGIDGDLDQVRAEHVASGLEENRERREGRLQLVRTQVGQQTAHEAAVVRFTCDVVVLRCLLRGLFFRVLGFFLICHLYIYSRCL